MRAPLVVCYCAISGDYPHLVQRATLNKHRWLCKKRGLDFMHSQKANARPLVLNAKQRKTRRKRPIAEHYSDSDSSPSAEVIVPGEDAQPAPPPSSPASSIASSSSASSPSSSSGDETPPTTDVDSDTDPSSSSSSDPESIQDEDPESIDPLLAEIFMKHRLRDLIDGYDKPIPQALEIGASLLGWKTAGNISTRQYNILLEILNSFRPQEPIGSFRATIRDLEHVVGFRPIRIDCCPKLCQAYTGPFRDAVRCSICGKRRYKASLPEDSDVPLRNHDITFDSTEDGVPYWEELLNRNARGRKPRKWYFFFPSVPALLRLWANPDFSASMKAYRDGILQRHLDIEKSETPEQRGDLTRPYYPITDWWDGRMYRHYMPHLGVLHHSIPGSDVNRRMALQMELDSGQLFDKLSGKTRNVMPFILRMLNLDPRLRAMRANKLLAMVLPGPREPGDLSSWLWPVWREFDKLSKGVHAIDGDSKEEFQLYAYLVLAVGDQIAIRTLSRLRGHGSRHPCRICDMMGIRAEGSRSKHYYLIHDPVLRPDQRSYDLLNLPLRRNMAQIMKDVGRNGDDEELERYGLSDMGVSPLLDVPMRTIHMLRGVPYPSMHTFPSGYFDNLLELWRGRHESDDGKYDGIQAPYIIESQWTEIGAEIEASAKTIPLELSPAIFNVSTHFGAFKKRANLKQAFMLLYLLPIMTGRLPEEYIEHLACLVCGYEEALAWTHTEQSLRRVELLMAALISGFERLYVGFNNDRRRISMAKSTAHIPAHTCDGIKDNGSLFVYWEWGLEDVVGDVLDQARSKSKPDEALNNALRAREAAKFCGIARQGFLANNRLLKSAAVSVASAVEETITPRGYRIDTGYFLNPMHHWDIHGMSRRLRNSLRKYVVAVKGELVLTGEMGKLPESGFMYERFKLFEHGKHRRTTGHQIGSAMSQRSDNRASHWVRYLNVASAGVPNAFTEENMAFGEVRYYGKMTLDIPRPNRSSSDISNASCETDFEHYVALIRPWRWRWLDEDNPKWTAFGRRRLLYFGAEDESVFIDARLIDCSVGRMATFKGRYEWIMCPGANVYANPLGLYY